MKIKDLIDDIGFWLKLQLRSRLKEGYVLGISGGVDSYTLALILAKNKIKNQLFHILYDQSDKTSEVVKDFKKDPTLNISIIDAKSTYNAFLKLVLETNKKSNIQNLLDTNIKARIREAIFYNNANISKFLVIGTINKEEYHLGYFVKNSSIGDILPFANISKSRIRQMALSLGVPEIIALKKASGCIDKRFAEEEWGITEHEMNKILTNDLVSIPKDKIILYLDKFEKNSHKREFPPIFPYK